MKTWLKVVVVFGLIVILVSGFAVAKVKRVAAAYVYGYPLVLMEQSRLAFLGSEHSGRKSNQFRHIQRFPDHRFRNVVRPNNDTLYSTAWIDLSDEPLILSVPNTGGRYYVMPLMDAWTNVFAMVGKRITGTEAGNYAIVGPNWASELPSDVSVIQSPTNMVWVIGRIQTNGQGDIAKVSDLQQKFSLTSLSNWLLGERNSSTVESLTKATNDPKAIVDALSAGDFFLQLSKLISAQGALEHDSEALNNLSKLGVDVNHQFKKLGLADEWLFEKAITITKRKLDESINSPLKLENGWVVRRSIIGNYNANYAFRAAVAKIGLGALPPDEAVYPNTRVDFNGAPLSGEKRYQLHFEEGQTPPVNAFWSLSMYDDQGFFTENVINRYSIGDRDSLEYNADGSLDIFIQADKPTKGISNWLPSPKSNFALTLRLYNPKQSFLDGRWQLPKIKPRI